jgi:hypothetical protein
VRPAKTVDRVKTARAATIVPAGIDRPSRNENNNESES